jgi:hypothetical protein
MCVVGQDSDVTRYRRLEYEQNPLLKFNEGSSAHKNTAAAYKLNLSFFLAAASPLRPGPLHD